VIRVGEIIEELDTADFADFLDDLLHFAFVSPLAEVGDTFQNFHSAPISLFTAEHAERSIKNRIKNSFFEFLF
jgi:hypothetical protein